MTERTQFRPILLNSLAYKEKPMQAKLFAITNPKNEQTQVTAEGGGEDRGAGRVRFGVGPW